MFQWRKFERQGALTAVSAGKAMVPASELAAAHAEIAKLQRVLGQDHGVQTPARFSAGGISARRAKSSASSTARLLRTSQKNSIF